MKTVLILASLLLSAPVAVAQTESFDSSEAAMSQEFDGRGGRWEREFICYAQDRRGNMYSAVGQNPRRVQNRAVNKCLRYARFCRAQGCREI